MPNATEAQSYNQAAAMVAAVEITDMAATVADIMPTVGATKVAEVMMIEGMTITSMIRVTHLVTGGTRGPSLNAHYTPLMTTPVT
jgi:hypothetical protein